MPIAIKDMSRKPYLELVVLGYAAWQSHNLVETWRNNPFDRWGWLAFMLWLLPLGGWFALTARQVIHQSDINANTRQASRSTGLLAVGLVLVFLADLGSLNVLAHAGLGCALLSLVPWRRLPAAWGLSALSWMPAFGWVGSRLNLDPAMFALCRVVIATAGAVYGWHCLRAIRTDRTAMDRQIDGPWPVVRGLGTRLFRRTK